MQYLTPVNSRNLYLKHNFDRGLIRPIVTTPEVIILIWACFAMVFLEAWLMTKGATRLFGIAYKVMLFIELLLVVFMDAAVRVTHAFQLFHSLVLIFLILFPVPTDLINEGC